jgi:hypothetical protein
MEERIILADIYTVKILSPTSWQFKITENADGKSLLRVELASAPRHGMHSPSGLFDKHTGINNNLS